MRGHLNDLINSFVSLTPSVHSRINFSLESINTETLRVLRVIVNMSWSFSLRSPSLTPPPLSTSPSTTDATSLWDNEGDRNDPIDIGSVWEPQIDFKETPFTIAKRNGGNQAGASSRLGFKLENLQQQKKKVSRPYSIMSSE